MDVSQYLEIFIDETKEHLQSLNEQLLILEKEPENDNTINEIFRAAHSLKGMAGTMGYKRMQRLTHDMENVFSEIRNAKMKVSAGLVDVLFQCLDALEGYLETIQQTAGEGTNDNEPIITQLNAILNAETGAQVVKKQEVKQEQEPVKVQDSVKFKSLYRDITLEPQEKHVISEAFEKGLNVFAFTVYIQETCILKAARAFLVFKGIEDVGETIKSIPSVQDIEDERFDLHFSMYIISKESYKTTLSVIQNVSEIEAVVGEEFTYETIQNLDKKLSSTSEQVQEIHETNEKESNSSVENVKATQSPQKTQASNNAKANTQKPVVNRTVRVDIEKLDVLMNLVSELIIAKNGLVSVSSSETGENSQGFHEQIEYLERVTTNLHESVMKTRMVPIESVVNRFPRMIRDLNKKLNKKMELYMTGEDTELDRTVIDEIGDPLMHLLRNSADHGLEPSEVRVQRGKPEVGSIFLDAYQEGNNVIIEVRDDGNGIDVNAVRNKAIERGTITTDQAESMSDKDIIDLLFVPSFSTAKTVSDVSGRGVGLDVVKSKIEALGGDVEVKSKLGEGSIWTIRLPLTLAIIQALMVELGDEKYAIALGSIQTIEDISIHDIKYVEAKEVIHIRETVIPLIRLDKVLGIVKNEEQPENLTVVIVKKGEKLAGLVVDNLMGQQEIVIKSLGKYINIDKVISGATILGDGEIALILDVNTLV